MEEEKSVEIFRKTVRPTEITNHRFVVPTEAMWAFLLQVDSNKLDIQALDVNGKTWNFRYVTRGPGSHHPQPYFSRGWMKFVRDNSLQAGDTIVFKLRPLNDPIYFIQVVRKNC
ncbi:hypothetical protein COLO4_25715 [Corchorus olitorius]|uniref:TF-B3 domain-containing protein n=1 Tax=Corchorus olitorius TaxID=93759 RepID=A0A1R3I0B2_9ROSI|nr:hypothetical protein COLO4_25715 [Corchorus olitorius]